MVMKKVGWYETLTKHLSRKRAINSYKNLDRVMSSFLLMAVMMVNKYCKCIKTWGGTKYLTKTLSRKSAIIITKTMTELCPLFC